MLEIAIKKESKRLELIYGSTLTTRDLMLLLGLNRGRELNPIIYSRELPTLHVDDVARYIISNRGYNLFDKLNIKYPYSLSIQDMAFELGIGTIELEVLLEMGILEDVSVFSIVRFLHNLDAIMGMLQDKKYIKKMYWDYSLTSKQIANILGIGGNTVLSIIRKYNLGKSKNGIKTTFRKSKKYSNQEPKRVDFLDGNPPCQKKLKEDKK